MEQTLFFALGIALVVIALALSAIGLRWESFPPSRPLLLGVTTLVAGMVVATGAFAWLNAEEEQDEHAAEHAAERQEAFEEQQAQALETQEQEAPAPSEEPTGEGGGASTAEGEALFADLGCGGCHTLEAAGTTGTTGPVLDETLRGQDEAYIRESIIDPNAQIASGFGPDIMPQTYGQDLSSAEIAALVAYLAQSTR